MTASSTLPCASLMSCVQVRLGRDDIGCMGGTGAEAQVSELESGVEKEDASNKERAKEADRGREESERKEERRGGEERVKKRKKGYFDVRLSHRVVVRGEELLVLGAGEGGRRAGAEQGPVSAVVGHQDGLRRVRG